MVHCSLRGPLLVVVYVVTFVFILNHFSLLSVKFFICKRLVCFIKCLCIWCCFAFPSSVMGRFTCLFYLSFCHTCTFSVVSSRLASSPYHSIVDRCLFLMPVSLSCHLLHIPFSVYITWSGSHRDNGTWLGEQMLCVAATWRAYITSTRAHSSSTAMCCFPASVAVIKNYVHCCFVVLSINQSVRGLNIFIDEDFFFRFKFFAQKVSFQLCFPVRFCAQRKFTGDICFSVSFLVRKVDRCEVLLTC